MDKKIVISLVIILLLVFLGYSFLRFYDDSSTGRVAAINPDTKWWGSDLQDLGGMCTKASDCRSLNCQNGKCVRGTVRDHEQCASSQQCVEEGLVCCKTRTNTIYNDYVCMLQSDCLESPILP